MALKARPVHQYPWPDYPTRLQALDDPDLLRQHLPSGWRQTELAGLVSLFLAANCTVRSGDRAAACPTTRTTTACSAEGTSKRAVCIASNAPAIVAPLFDHGEGRGAIGCVVVNPPVFLSEDEALQVIGEEMRHARLEMEDEESTLQDVRMGWWSRLSVVRVKCTPQIGVVFAGRYNYSAFGGEVFGGGTAQGYDIKGAASLVARKVREHGHGIYLGTFYDPLASIKERSPVPNNGRRAEQQAVTESREQLRQQVRDFVQWLQGQGAI